MTLLDELRANREKILALAAECGLEDVRVFGSVARCQEGPDSDIDIVVSRRPGLTMGLKTYEFPAMLGQMFGREVDFVVEPTLHWVIKEQVLKEAQPI